MKLIFRIFTAFPSRTAWSAGLRTRLPIAKEWQPIYAVVFLDAYLHYYVRSEGQIVKKAAYNAIGIDLDGRKDVLGMWVGKNESAKFWATVLNGLKNRGVEDIFIACAEYPCRV